MAPTSDLDLLGVDATIVMATSRGTLCHSTEHSTCVQSLPASHHFSLILDIT